MSDVRTTFHPQSEGGFVLNSVQDVEPILENNKTWQGERQTGDGLRRVASIPAVIWMQWLTETNGELDRMDKVTLARFIKRKLADPSNAFLRTT